MTELGSGLMIRRKRAEMKIKLHDAKTEADEARTWVCETCTILIESGRFCLSCALYWEDVKKGLYSEE